MHICLCMLFISNSVDIIGGFCMESTSILILSGFFFGWSISFHCICKYNWLLFVVQIFHNCLNKNCESLPLCIFENVAPNNAYHLRQPFLNHIDFLLNNRYNLLSVVCVRGCICICMFHGMHGTKRFKELFIRLLYPFESNDPNVLCPSVVCCEHT